MKKFIISIVLSLMTTVSHASWVEFQKVTAVHSSTNEIHFKTNTSDLNSPCLWKNTWALEKSHPEFDEIYKMLLSAQLTGQPGRVSGNDQCSGSQPYKQKVSSFLLGTW